MQRFVLDTNVVVSGLRTPSGASAALLRAGRSQQVVLLANVAMALEYEAVCRLPEHREAAGLHEQGIEDFLNALVAFLDPVESHVRWPKKRTDLFLVYDGPADPKTPGLDGDRSVPDVLVNFFPLKPGKHADAYFDLLEELDSGFFAACLSARDSAHEYPYVLEALEKRNLFRRRNLCASSSMIAGTIPFI